MRMPGPRGNPQARNLFEIVAYLQHAEGVRFEVRSTRAALRTKQPSSQGAKRAAHAPLRLRSGQARRAPRSPARDAQTAPRNPVRDAETALCNSCYSNMGVSECAFCAFFFHGLSDRCQAQGLQAVNGERMPKGKGLATGHYSIGGGPFICGATRAELVGYATSGDVTGDREESGRLRWRRGAPNLPWLPKS